MSANVKLMAVAKRTVSWREDAEHTYTLSLAEHLYITSYGFFLLLVQCATFYSFYYCTLNCILNLNGTLRRLLRAAECSAYGPTPLILLCEYMLMCADAAYRYAAAADGNMVRWMCVCWCVYWMNEWSSSVKYELEKGG